MIVAKNTVFIDRNRPISCSAVVDRRSACPNSFMPREYRESLNSRSSLSSRSIRATLRLTESWSVRISSSM